MRTPSLALLLSVVAPTVASADIPVPGPASPSLIQWTDSGDFPRTTLLIAAVALAVAVAAVVALWALRRSHRRAMREGTDAR